MKIKKIKSNTLFVFISTLLFFVHTHTRTIGQCSYPVPRTVETYPDTTILSFLIEGAVNNSMTTNQVCGVRLAFSHEYVGDLSIYLVSPSGQEIQLIGPSVELSPLTQFINWDVTIIPCSTPAAPDQGLFPVWDNLGNWIQFNDYNGTYYPQNGCFEDINTGPVNGTWALRIEDPVEFGSGVIETAEIYFCDDTGIQCESCVAYAGVFDDMDIQECEGKQELFFYPDITFEDPEPPSDVYDYKFVILDVNGYVQIQDTVDLRDFSPATYQICGLSIENTQLSMLDITFGMQKNEIEDVILDNVLCADLTNECISFTIRDVLDTVLISENICAGSSFIYEGTVYDSVGTYVTGYSGNNCDTLTLLELSVYNINAEITGGDQLYGCSNNRITLNGTNSRAQDSISYLWRTDDGQIRTDITASSVVISQSGTYYLDVSAGYCTVTDTVVIMDDGSGIEIDLMYDTVDCINLSTQVVLNTNVPITSLDWRGPAAFSQNGNDIVVSVPGTYYFNATGDNGCTISDTAYVIGDKDVPNPAFGNTDITCDNFPMDPGITFSDSSELTFSWSSSAGFTSTMRNPGITAPGIYTVEITADNGCTESTSIAVNDLRQFPVLTSNTDTLTCIASQVSIGVNSSIPNVEYNWTGPGGFVSTSQNPIVDQEGSYMVSVTTTAACTSVDTMVVGIDEKVPIVSAPDVTISCSDSGFRTLNVVTDADNPSYLWTGPYGYTAVGANPIVRTIGTYEVQVTGSNGCSRTVSFEVLPDSDLPQLEFVSDTLDCDQPFVEIFPSDSTGLTFTYEDPMSSTYNEISPITALAGEYLIRITAGPCFVDYTHFVEVDSVFPQLDFNIEEIDCDTDSIRLNFTSAPLRATTWSGPSSFSSDFPNPFTDTAGEYIINATAYNGCETTDTIMVVENYMPPTITPVDTFFTCVSDQAGLIALVTDVSPRSFSWSGPGGFTSMEDTATIFLEGMYFVTVTGTNGCVNFDSLSVGYDTIPAVIQVTIDTALTCLDPISTITLTSNESGISTQWYGPADTIIGVTTLDVGNSGTWKVIVTDASSCVTEDSVKVVSEIIYPELVTEYNNINCSDTTASVLINIDSLVDSIVWQAPIVIEKDVLGFTTEIIGTYTYTAFGSNGCDTTISFDIVVDTIPPDITLTVSDTITCDIPQVSLNVNSLDNLVSYSWTSESGNIAGNESIQVSNPGRYQVRAFKDNGCFATDTSRVFIDSLLPIITAIGDTMTCATGQRAILDVEINISDYTVIWTSDNGFISDVKRSLATEPGIYRVEVTGINGCTTTDLAEIVRDINEPRIFLDDQSYLLCDSSASRLDVTSDVSGVDYNWYGPNNFFSMEQSPLVSDLGTYVVYARGKNGCRSIDTTVVTVDTRVPQYNLVAENILCIRDTAVINLDFVNDDNIWVWEGPSSFSSNDEDLKVTEPGIYTVYIEGANRCRDTSMVEVMRDVERPEALATTNEIIQCTNRDIFITGAGSSGSHSLQYNWSTTDGIILSGEHSVRLQVRDTGTYMLGVTDVVNGCYDDTSIVVSETPQDFVDFEVLAINPSCPGYKNGEINVVNYSGGYEPYNLSVDGGIFVTNKDRIPFLDVGTYNLTVRDSLGCIISKNIVVEDARNIKVDLGKDTLINFGDSLTITALLNFPSSDIAALNWTPVEEVDCANCLEQNIKPYKNTFYKIKVVDSNGCSTEDVVFVRVEELPDLTFPNVFKPTSTNDNEIFYIPQTKGIKRINYLSIIDRWGNRMYHAENFEPGNKEFGWNGEFLDQRVRPGVFAVIAEILLDNDRTVLIKSDLTLIR